MVQIRCRRVVRVHGDGSPFLCNRLLAQIEEGSGVIICKCKHRNEFEVRTGNSRQWYNDMEKAAEPHTAPVEGVKTK